MGMFSKLFWGDNGADALPPVQIKSSVSESLSATVTGGFVSAKRVLSGMVQPTAAARFRNGEALWIPLPVEEDTYDEPADSDSGPLAATQHSSGESQKSSKRPPPLPSAQRRNPELDATLQSFVESFEIPQVLADYSEPHPAALAELVEAAVDALFDERDEPSGVHLVTEHADDKRAVMETFAGVARVHGRPLREFMFQLSVGSTPRSWAHACRPLLQPLLGAAQQIECEELAQGLRALDAALERAVNSSHATQEPIDSAASDAIQAAYEQLRVQLPEVFSASTLADLRRLTLFESLLLQVPGMHRRTIGKLYAAGLSTVGQLSQASAAELSAVVNGLDQALAEAIVEQVQRFERERNQVEPGNVRGHLHGRMREAVGRLGQLQAEFERADVASSQEQKKTVRRAREAAVLELQRLFAEIGDLTLIDELKRCSVRGKIRRVHTYLETQLPA